MPYSVLLLLPRPPRSSSSSSSLLSLILPSPSHPLILLSPPLPLHPDSSPAQPTQPSPLLHLNLNPNHPDLSVRNRWTSHNPGAFYPPPPPQSTRPKCAPLLPSETLPAPLLSASLADTLYRVRSSYPSVGAVPGR